MTVAHQAYQFLTRYIQRIEKAKGYDKINSCIAISLQWENVKNTILERKI